MKRPFNSFHKKAACMSVYKALGLMSGTSLDGLDLAYLETDGEGFSTVKETASCPFPADLRALLSGAVSKALALGVKTSQDPFIQKAERAFTEFCADKAEYFLTKVGKVDLVGFHGQTLLHAPEKGFTWQMGQGQVLADRLNTPVIEDFRSDDVKNGGQGAPLVPLYHQALLKKAQLCKPAMIVNLGGVANITWSFEDQVYAFDTGPANGLIDLWMQEQAGLPYDQEGALAALGMIDKEAFSQMVAHPFFHKPAPKSMDRHGMTVQAVEGLSLADGAATLTALTAWSLRHSMMFVPQVPDLIFLAGGGQNNKTLVSMIQKSFPKAEFFLLETVGSDPQSLEAEAFAYLAVRSYKGLPLSLPETTGVKRPQTGGRLVQPQLAQEAC
jgi:anhydro-N-acetylmuramic acid kinase